MIDLNGNMTFTLSIENKGNTSLTGLRFVDVFPHADDEVEPASNTDEDGVTTPTLGDGRTPPSDFAGTLGVVSQTGSGATVWVTGDPASDVSRDPDAAITDTVWCNAVGGTVQAGPATATDADCPATANDVTATYSSVSGSLRPGRTYTQTLTLDSEGAECNDIWTNTFGARADQLNLPIRSNDVSIMVNCEFDLALQKRVDPDWRYPADWPTIDESTVTFELEIVNQGDPVHNVDVTDYVDTDVFEFVAADNPNGTSSAGTLGASGTGPALPYSWTGAGTGTPVVTLDGLLPAGASTVVPVHLRLRSLPDQLDNLAEISNFDDDDDPENGDASTGEVTDIDSTHDGDNDEPGDDLLIDDEIDLTPDDGDEDDHDIASVPWWDLALVKDLSDGQTRTIAVNPDGTATVSFDLLVKNQGPSIATDIGVLDTPPAGLTDASTNPTGDQDLGGITVTYAGDGSFTIASLAAGQSVRISVAYDIDVATAATGDLTNTAEITELHDTEVLELAYSLGNEVWNDVDNDGLVDADEAPIPGVKVVLFTDEDGDGAPDDRNDDGVITDDDAVATDITDDQGLYLFEGLSAGGYIVGISAENWAPGGPLTAMVSSTPTSEDPDDDIDQDDNGMPIDGMVRSGPVTIGPLEPTAESGPDNDDNLDALSNLTVDFGFHRPNFDLALRKTLAAGESDTIYDGDEVTFDIEVFNQGDVTAVDVTVVDYLPAELVLADPDWTEVRDGVVSIAIPGPIEPGDSVVVQITVTVAAAGAIDNLAEISEATPVDEEGDPITTPDGGNVPDVDSTPDDTDDDELIDDEIDLTPTDGDEDDHDISTLLTIESNEETTTTRRPRAR